MAIKKPATAPARASQRARLALLSEPVKSTAMPARIGSHTTVLRSARPCMSASGEPQRKHYENANDHGERVMINAARLQLSRNAGNPSHQASGAVDEDSIY